MSGDVGYDAFLPIALFVVRLNSPSGSEDDFGYSVIQDRSVQGDVIDVSIAGCLLNPPLFQEVQCFDDMLYVGRCRRFSQQHPAVVHADTIQGEDGCARSYQVSHFVRLQGTLFGAALVEIEGCFF